MTRKSILTGSLLIIVSIGIGILGTIFVQKSGWVEVISKAAQEVKGHPEGKMVPIGEFTVNLKSSSFLKTTITLEVADEKAEEIIKAKEPVLKDQIISVISDKSIEDVETVKGREELRKELISKLNEISGENVTNVLFVSFVYQ